MTSNLIRDGLELLIAIAVGGMLFNVIRRAQRDELRVYRCIACNRPTSRGYPRCKHCDVEQPDAI